MKRLTSILTIAVRKNAALTPRHNPLTPSDRTMVESASNELR